MVEDAIDAVSECAADDEGESGMEVYGCVFCFQVDCDKDNEDNDGDNKEECAELLSKTECHASVDAWGDGEEVFDKGFGLPLGELREGYFFANEVDSSRDRKNKPEEQIVVGRFF